MARQYKTFVSGTLGNVVFYELNGIPVARTKPAKVKQSKATKASAKDFGIAAGYSRQVRQLLAPIERFIDKRKLMYLLNKNFLQWITDNRASRSATAQRLKSLLMINLNDERLPSRVQTWKPEVGIKKTKIVVSIPALNPMDNIKAPKNTKEIDLTFIALNLHLDEPGKNSDHPPEQIIKNVKIPYRKTEVASADLEFQFKHNSHNLSMLIMTTGFNIADRLSSFPCRDKKWLGAEVVGCWYKESV